MKVEWTDHAQTRFRKRVDPKRVDLAIVHPTLAESGLNRRIGEVWHVAVHGVVWVCTLSPFGSVRITTCYPNRNNAVVNRPVPKAIGAKTKNWKKRNRRTKVEE